MSISHTHLVPLLLYMLCFTAEKSKSGQMTNNVYSRPLNSTIHRLFNPSQSINHPLLLPTPPPCKTSYHTQLSRTDMVVSGFLTCQRRPYLQCNPIKTNTASVRHKQTSFWGTCLKKRPGDISKISIKSPLILHSHQVRVLNFTFTSPPHWSPISPLNLHL